MINLASVKRGTYFDSITLMRLARTLSEMEEVADAAAVMGTPANLQLLADAGLSPFMGLTVEPGSDDVLIVVRANDEAHARAALAAAERQLLNNITRVTQDADATGHVRQPRSLEEARRGHEQASIAVISVPGMYAALEAQQALQAGLHVFLFSDNVSLEDEVALKKLGTARGLLVMGPDCGTARLNGVGLGFANVTPDGPVGIVGASGTGMQQVMCLLAQAGYGISQAIGCGGRDLSAEVGGATTLQGLRLLQQDEQTRVIVLISKPPAPAVAERVLSVAASSGKPVVVVFLGADSASWRDRYADRLSIAPTLTAAAHRASALCTAAGLPAVPQRGSAIRHSANVASDPVPGEASRPGQPPYLAALYSGGTLCEEALHIWRETLGPVYSNVSLNPAWIWHKDPIQPGHYALDLGADEYTRGRPHPMIDPEARLKYLRTAANDAQIGVILLDIVLGYCAHPDPAAIYAPLIQEGIRQANRAGRSLRYVITLCGTEGDPQCLSSQEAALCAAGAETYVSNAEAAERCLEILTKQAN